MARRIPEDRFEALVRHATAVFIERGHRRTQMADVAAAIGVAKGTLYGYVDGKEALFALCLALADVPGPIPLPEALPLPNPAPGEIGQRVKEALAEGARQPALERALAAPVPADASGVAAELRTIVAELFDLMHARRFGIKLLDRCLDHPELEGLWREGGREPVRAALERHLATRAAQGALRVDDSAFAARYVVEACATWAVHVHWDPAPQRFDAQVARDSVIDFVVRGLVA